VPQNAGQFEFTVRAVHGVTGAVTWAGGFGANCRIHISDCDNPGVACGISRSRLAAMFGSAHRLCLERLAEVRGDAGPHDADYTIAYALGLLGAELRSRGERRAVVVALLDMALRLAAAFLSDRFSLVRSVVGCLQSLAHLPPG
jgi:hypothetical protein